MAQYIPKSALVAEIEKLKGQLLRGACSSQIYMQTRCKEESYDEVLSFLDTLEVKEVDSKLSLEDISILRQIMFDYNRQVRNEMSIPNNEDYCKEILKRFKAQKGE